MPVFLIPLADDKGLNSKVSYFVESMNFVAIVKGEDVKIISLSYPTDVIDYADRSEENVILTPGISQNFLSLIKAANLKVKLIPDDLCLRDVLALISTGVL